MKDVSCTSFSVIRRLQELPSQISLMAELIFEIVQVLQQGQNQTMANAERAVYYLF